MIARPIFTLDDLFCGAGGTSEGAVEAIEALGYRVKLFAANHWEVAKNTFAANFPWADVRCAGVDSFNPRLIHRGEKLHMLWASPECTGHSDAAQGQPRNEQSRATAMCVARWAEAVQPDIVLVENVRAFKRWGPLDSRGRPLKSREGELYRAWFNLMCAAGYRGEEWFGRAANYGDPTTRERLFIQFVRGRRRIVWPNPTHSPTGSTDLFVTLRPWVPARDIVDLSVHGRWLHEMPGKKKYDDLPLSPKTIARIWTGFTQNGGEAFLVHTAHGGNDDRSRPLSSPLPSICGNRGDMALIQPYLLPQQGGGALRPLSQPVPTVSTDGAIALIEPYIIKYYGTGIAKPLSETLDAVTTKDRFALICPTVFLNGEKVQFGFRYRLLMVKELAAAQGFLPTHIFTGNKTEQIKQIGNAVPRRLARAIVAAALTQNPDVSWLIDRDEAATSLAAAVASN